MTYSQLKSCFDGLDVGLVYVDASPTPFNLVGGFDGEGDLMGLYPTSSVVTK